MQVSLAGLVLTFSDQWDYLTPFFRHNPGFSELFFWQYGHRQDIGLFLDKFLFPWTRWNTRVDSFVIAGPVGLHCRRPRTTLHTGWQGAVLQRGISGPTSSASCKVVR
jgi:hypothetical protein